MHDLAQPPQGHARNRPLRAGDYHRSCRLRQRAACRFRRRYNRIAAKARHPNRRKPRQAKGRRIPTRIAKRLEHKLKRPVDLQKYAVKVASLGIDILSIPQTSVTGSGRRINWVANNTCLPDRLRTAIAYVAQNFGRVRVNSTCRSPRHNRRVGGARRSWHLKGRAADIRVFGNIGKTARYLRRVVGGFKHYDGGLFHIDTGPRRRW